MATLFESFESDLNWQQLHLLLDTVTYFEDAPKLLSIPNLQNERIAVPMTADTLRQLLAACDEAQPFEQKRFAFAFTWVQEDEQTGTLAVTLPSGQVIEQPTVVTEFSPV